MTKHKVTLRWSGPEGTFDTEHECPAGRFGRVVDNAVAAAEAGTALVGLVHESGQVRRPLRHSGYRAIAAKGDRLILENSEGGQSLWRVNDEAPEVVFYVGNGWVFERRLAPTDAVKLRRRWEGIDPDEDAAEGLDDVLPEQEVVNPPHMRIPPEARPEESPEFTQLDIDRRAKKLAEQAGVTITEENQHIFLDRAKQQLEARRRAPTLNVPALNHDQIQAVPVIVRDGETGEMRVTHAYHDLHAPDGETTTRRMDEAAHSGVAEIIADCAVRGDDTQTTLNAVAANISAGQIWDWEDVARRAGEILQGRGHAYHYHAETVRWVMAQEQDNTPSHGWTLAWPNVHLYNPSVDELAFCEVKDPQPWILPIRFIQCGPVPFGPMCPDCLVALEAMDASDERLLAPEQRPGWEEEQDEIVMLAHTDGPPKFFACGGCDHYHPSGWVGDCRDDSMRFTGQALDNRYGPEGWVVVDEASGQPDPEAAEGGAYETEPDPYREHDEN